VTQLACCKTVPGIRVRVSKRDIRHFFHKLRNGKAWRRYMAHPPAGSGRRGFRVRNKFAPVPRAWPMGFAGSATIAQAVADVAVHAASLPTSQRVRYGDLPPMRPPVFGVMSDDVWAFDQAGSNEEGLPSGKEMLESIGEAWTKCGLEEHLGKRLEETSGELQGYFIHPSQHWVGVSVDKRAMMWISGLWIATQHRPALMAVERAFGKLGFAASARRSTRSIFQEVYRWLVKGRDDGVARVSWTPEVFLEMHMICALLPFM
jgi:hypothetical protein